MSSPFFTVELQQTDAKLPAGTPNRYLVQVHHPSLSGKKPSPSDIDVYNSKLCVGASVLVDRATLEKRSQSDLWESQSSSWKTVGLHEYAMGYSYAFNFDSIVGTLQGPGTKPHTQNVLQDGAAGELIHDVPEDVMAAGARQRMFKAGMIHSKDLDWEIRFMWPSILQKVSFEVGGSVQEGPVFIDDMRAGKLVARIVERSSGEEILVPFKADPSYTRLPDKRTVMFLIYALAFCLLLLCWCRRFIVEMWEFIVHGSKEPPTQPATH